MRWGPRRGRLLITRDPGPPPSTSLHKPRDDVEVAGKGNMIPWVCFFFSLFVEELLFQEKSGNVGSHSGSDTNSPQKGSGAGRREMLGRK